MLVNLRDICSIAEQNNMAIAAFNTPSLEAIRAAIDAAEETGYPVIIQHAECHDRPGGAIECAGMRSSRSR